MRTKRSDLAFFSSMVVISLLPLFPLVFPGVYRSFPTPPLFGLFFGLVIGKMYKSWLNREGIFGPSFHNRKSDDLEA